MGVHRPPGSRGHLGPRPVAHVREGRSLEGPWRGWGRRPAPRTDNPGGRVCALPPETPPPGVPYKKRGKVCTEVCAVGGCPESVIHNSDRGGRPAGPTLLDRLINASSSLQGTEHPVDKLWDVLGCIGGEVVVSPAQHTGGTEAMKSLGC